MRQARINVRGTNVEVLLREIAVFGFFFLFIFFVRFLDRFEFDWIDRGHFEVSTALGAGDDLTFVYLVVLNIKTGLTLWTVQHKPSVRDPGFMIARLYIYCLLGCRSSGRRARVFTTHGVRELGLKAPRAGLALMAKPIYARWINLVRLKKFLLDQNRRGAVKELRGMLQNRAALCNAT